MLLTIYHPLTIQSSFMKQRASMDTCLLANGHSYHFLWSTCWLLSELCIIPLTIKSGFIKNKELPQTNVCCSSKQINGSVRGMIDGDMFVNSLNA